MLKSEYVIAAVLFALGVVFIASSPSVTGAVTGNFSKGSMWFSLVGLLFIITAGLLLISSKYHVDTPDFGSDSFDIDQIHNDDFLDRDMDMNSEVEPKPRKE